MLVAGASGFVGAALAELLVDQGHEVTAVTCRPASYLGAGTPVGADVQDAATVRAAMAGQDAAYYLVHSLTESNFAELDRTAARNFGEAAHACRLRQVIYLGGLGADGDDLSEHLRSRREVEAILRDTTATTALRAGIVVGDGGISWEILRQLVERLPVMITPRWVQTRSQPVALDDALYALSGVLGRDDSIGEIYELGGSEGVRRSASCPGTSAGPGRRARRSRRGSPRDRGRRAAHTAHRRARQVGSGSAPSAG